MENKNLHELSRLELQELFNHEFKKNYKEENYSVKNWNNINEIYKR